MYAVDWNILLPVTSFSLRNYRVQQAVVVWNINILLAVTPFSLKNYRVQQAVVWNILLLAAVLLLYIL